MPRRNPGPHLRWVKRARCYYIVWYEAGRDRQRSTRTASREAAEVLLSEFLLSRAGRHRPRDPHEVEVNAVLLDYMEQRAPHLGATERVRYASVPLSAFFEGKTVGDITEATCAAFREWRGRSHSTVRRDLGVLRAAIARAVETGTLTRPVKVYLPAESKPRERWLTRSEAAKLLAAALGFDATGKRVARPQYHLALFILLGIYTGRRKEAITSLQWRQVDFQTGWIDFTRPGQAETKKRRGRCRIPSKLLPHLRRASRFGSAVGPVISWAGKPAHDIKRTFNTGVARAGLEDVSPHTLKHTAISWAMQSGAEPWQVADFFATSLTTVLTVYGHHHPDQQAALADRIGSARAIPALKAWFYGLYWCFA